jgi:hypothetical protein
MIRYLQGVGRVEEEARHSGLVSEGLDHFARLGAVHLEHRGSAGNQKANGARVSHACASASGLANAIKQLYLAKEMIKKAWERGDFEGAFNAHGKRLNQIKPKLNFSSNFCGLKMCR